jgi:hypothetical protein
VNAKLTRAAFRELLDKEFPTAVHFHADRGLEITCSPTEVEAIRAKALSLGYLIPEPARAVHSVSVLRVFGFPRRPRV